MLWNDVGFFRRIFSVDLRLAQQAEAAGNLDVAAQRYALAGDYDGAVRMHMARAARAADRVAELAALRDALRWACEGVDQGTTSKDANHTADAQLLVARAAAALGKALWTAAKAEGIATARDRVRVKEAAGYLMQGKDFARAGQAYESIADFESAAQAYSAGGLLDKLEKAIALDDSASHRERTEKNAVASYLTNMEIGCRDQAFEDLRIAIANSSEPAPHRTLLDALAVRLLTGGRVSFRSGTANRMYDITVIGLHKTVIGRDALCDLVLVAGGVSRQHAEIHVEYRQGGPDDRRELSRPLFGGAATEFTPPRVAHAGPRYGANERTLGAGPMMERTGEYWGAGPDMAQEASFWLVDQGSRNGTKLSGLPLLGRAELQGRGTVEFGDQAQFEFVVANNCVALTGIRGREKGRIMVITAPNTTVSLHPWKLPWTVCFANDRPWLQPIADAKVWFDDSPLAARVQLIRGDSLQIEHDIRIEVS
jgi:tetratricopeptide (TPR) repeat protein